MTRRLAAFRLSALGPAALAVVLLAIAAPAQAAADPMPAPGDFRNGQENDFGSIAMVPYLSAGSGSMPVEARIVLKDLEALAAANDVLVAFNVKGDAVRVTFESLRTPDGKALAPVTTATVDHGRQPQAHFLPADLLAAAKDGRVDLVLKGRLEARADSQSHVGAMAIAFDQGWGILPSGDGPAQLYGFTMVSSVGLGAGAMPFQGQGNTWAMLPLALVALVVALAGATAVSFLARMPALAPPPAVAAVAPPLAGPATIPTFGQPPPGAPRPAPAGIPARSTASPAVPVFGGPSSPVVPERPAPLASAVRPSPSPPQRPARPAAVGPLQGPLLPPQPLDRTPLAALMGTAAPAPQAPVPAAEATATLTSRPGPPAAPGKGRGRPPATPGGPVLTATRRPKAKSAANASEGSARPARTGAKRPVPPQASR